MIGYSGSLGSWLQVYYTLVVLSNNLRSFMQFLGAMLLIDVENGGEPTDPSALLLPDDDTPPALWRLHLRATQANSRDQATC